MLQQNAPGGFAVIGYPGETALRDAIGHRGRPALRRTGGVRAADHPGRNRARGRGGAFGWAPACGVDGVHSVVMFAAVAGVTMPGLAALSRGTATGFALVAIAAIRARA